MIKFAIFIVLILLLGGVRAIERHVVHLDTVLSAAPVGEK